MRVLIAEENESCAELLRTFIEQQEWEGEVCGTGTRAVELSLSKRFDVLLLALNLPELDGFEVLQRVQELLPTLKVIVISGSMGVAETVRAMKAGAYHCFSKPLDFVELRDVLGKVARRAGAATSSQAEMVAVSAPMRTVTTVLRRVAQSKTCTVLITGETGTGKEIVARRLHRLSERRDSPFVAVNCSAIPASLIESELFGHEKGAFTDARATRKGYFEAAEDGSIFLDEIGDLSMELQSRLLRVLQERNFRRVGGTQEIALHARVIAATNVDLAAAVRAGRFREDLYYRLAVIPIHLLPLRKRIADILPLAKRFIGQISQDLNCEAPELSEAQERHLEKYAWPGNVRELRNVIERFVLMNGILEFVPSGRIDTPPLEDGQAGAAVEQTERDMIYTLLLRKFFASEVTANVDPVKIAL